MRNLYMLVARSRGFLTTVNTKYSRHTAIISGVVMVSAVDGKLPPQFSKQLPAVEAP